MRSTVYLFATASGLTFGGMGFAPTAFGQSTPPAQPAVNNSVVEKTAIPPRTAVNGDEQTDDAAREALLPVGAHFGSFTFYPKLETQIGYNDNIFALGNKTSDGIAKISPSFDLRGDFGTATAALRGTFDRYQYFNNPRENRSDWSLGTNGQVELKRYQFLYVAGGFSRSHEDRGDPNSTATSREPTQYNLAEAGLGLSSDATRTSYGIDLSYRHFNFVNGQQIGGALINNDDRDRSQYRAAARIGYEFSPGYRLLARGSYERIDYELPIDDGGFNRDSEGFRGTLGVNFELSKLLQGEVFGGYLRRTYTDPRFQPIDRGVFGARLTWEPTQITKVRLDVDRNVQETVAGNYRAFVSTTYSIGIEHEFRRNFVVSVNGRYGADDYQRSSVVVAERKDDNYGASVNARYTLNRNVYTSLNYDYSQRTSNVAFQGVEFNRNKVAATIGLQF